MFASLNYKIQEYLAKNNITYSPNDFIVIQPGNNPEEIRSWNTEKLGPQPTQEQLDALTSEVTNKLAWDQIRNQRQPLLNSSDWTQTTDYNGSNKAAWATYRQALRDIPQNQTDPNNIVWPTLPN